MDFVSSLAGMIEVEITSADILGMLQLLGRAEIPLMSVRYLEELSATVRIYRKDYKRLKSLCQKRGDSIRLLSRKGLYWRFKAMGKRWPLILGLLFFAALGLLLPTRILFVQVEGNASVPANKIIEAAEHCGIRFGANRRQIRSEKIKNQLLQTVPQLQWVGVNTKGCVAVISVRERAVMQEIKGPALLGHIVAKQDGIITECTATRGSLLCGPGQPVTQGQILISGYTDCNLVTQICQAEGEIYAQTTRKITAVTPSGYQQKQDTGGIHRKISLIVGKKRIILWKDSGIWDTTCGRIYAEKYITLPGGFEFPVGWSVDTCYEAVLQTEASAENAESMLREFAEGYVKQQMIAGVIQSQFQSFYQEADLCRLEGKYICTEMIGIQQIEKIGELNG